MARDKLLQIQRLQNTSIRGIAGIPRYIPVSVIHKELKIEPVASYISKVHQNFHSTIGTHSNPSIQQPSSFQASPLNLPPLSCESYIPSLGNQLSVTYFLLEGTGFGE
ncbi:hypothetical protein TNCT_614131 [Trichonephila clavata]|uniref:Uncharacterized protein n=1 Tax=Trichonephila clavata TaxID=2740835 RepID=A0A8X6M365_TRICU|nr:hypothetical protein TNCT_614131 [Trichonephila clavata]